MDFPVTFLKAADGIHLTKQYWLNNNILNKSNYPHVFNFSSTTVRITDIEGFYDQIEEHASQFESLLKGNVRQQLDNQSRAGSTDPFAPTHWICLDIDGLKNVQNEEDLISQIPCLQGVSYITQASSSMGVEPEKGLSKHLFFILDKPQDPQLLKNWLIHLNLTVPLLKDSISLSRTFISLRWPLDVSTCQNDKILYISPPVLGEGVIDHYNDKRIKLVKKEKDTVSIDFSVINLERNDHEKKTILNKLRKAKGLPAKRKETFRLHNNVEIESNPGKASVTGRRKERGFVYLNLNGGDSWAYYYPEDNPEILFNFKNEPNYLIKEFLPEYYERISSSAGPAIHTNKGIEWLAFKDKRTQQYYVGHYDWEEKELDVVKTDNKDKVKDFLKEHGQPAKDFIPTWNYEIDFTNDEEFNPDKKFINQYIKSKYMKYPNMDSRQLPPLTDKLLSHSLGDLKEHFINWLAVIVQLRIKTNMAWVVTGVQGSGKGVIANNIVVPLIGENYTHILNNLTSFEKEFNRHLATALFTAVDEACISDSSRYVKVANKIKNLITEERISIRQMRTDEYMLPNHNNWMFLSNQFDPIQVDVDDRRFTVAMRQCVKLLEIMSKDEIEKGLKAELYDLSGYLMNYSIDVQRASTAIDTDDKRKLQELGVDSGTATANAIMMGNLDFFVEQSPGRDDLLRLGSVLNIDNPPSYKFIIDEFMNSKGRKSKIPKNYLRILFFYAAGIKHDNPGQFTRHMNHKGLFMKQIWYNGKNEQGYTTTWNIDQALEDKWASIHPKKELELVKKGALEDEHPNNSRKPFAS